MLGVLTALSGQLLRKPPSCVARDSESGIDVSETGSDKPPTEYYPSAKHDAHTPHKFTHITGKSTVPHSRSKLHAVLCNKRRFRLALRRRARKRIPRRCAFALATQYSTLTHLFRAQ